VDPSNDNQVLAAICGLLAGIPHGVQVISMIGTPNFTVPTGVTWTDAERWGGYASYGTKRCGGDA
jgi:hypothetical protein